MSKDVFAKLMQNAVSRTRWHEDRETAERILNQRRERYANDPKYREAIKESVRRNRKKNKKKHPSGKRRSFNRDRVLVVNGSSVFLYSSGKAAHLIGIATRTLELWERKDIIPINRMMDSVGRRWYPADYVTFISEQFSSRSPDQQLSDWSARVKEAWQLRQLSDSPIPVVCERLDPDEQGGTCDG